tara:strand:- start:101 stop:403 length:303 start_codon:yes stop_codon:yes gene_type:complete
MDVFVNKMAGTINIKMKNKILSIHAEWLKNNGYKKEYKDCVKQSKEYSQSNDWRQTKLKRTCVHAKPRASLCTTTDEAVSNRGGVEPLLLQKYVHGNCRG